MDPTHKTEAGKKSNPSRINQIFTHRQRADSPLPRTCGIPVQPLCPAPRGTVSHVSASRVMLFVAAAALLRITKDARQEEQRSPRDTMPSSPFRDASIYCPSAPEAMTYLRGRGIRPERRENTRGPETHLHSSFPCFFQYFASPPGRRRRSRDAEADKTKNLNKTRASASLSLSALGRRLFEPSIDGINFFSLSRRGMGRGCAGL